MRNLTELRISGRLFVLICLVATASVASAADDWLPTVPTGTTTVEILPFVSGLNGSFSSVNQYFASKMVPIPDGSGRNVISTFGGLLRVVDGNGTFLDNPLGGPYLDTTTSETEIGPFAYGMTSVAFHPDFANSGADGFGKLYSLVTESAKSDPNDYDFQPTIGTLNQHAAVLVEYTVDPAAIGSNRLFTSGPSQNVMRRELFVTQEPDNEHNFGDLAFDTNNLLYITAGDGFFNFNGGVNPEAFNAQALSTPLGKVLRIDPTGNNSVNGNYGLPIGAGGNVFANDGDPNTLGEIYSYGHRNPWRISTDAISGEVIVGEVGHFNIEEVNRIQNGGNYGWPHLEGTFLINQSNGFDLTPDADGNSNGIGDFAEANGMIEPLYEYDHQDGRSVTGGYIYRGTLLPQLQGKYVFAEFDGGDFAGTRLFVGDLATEQFEALQISTAGSPLPGGILSFGTDANNELYIMTTSGDIFSIVAPTPPPPPTAEQIANGSFEDAGGSLINWTSFGDIGPNIDVNNEAALDGTFSLDMTGQFTGGNNFAGIFQGVPIGGGETLKVSSQALVAAAETLAGTGNTAEMKIEFYSQFGASISSEFFLGQTIEIIADSSTPTDTWLEHVILLDAPANAVEARMTFVFVQPASGPGAVHVDLASLLILLDADFNTDGNVDGDDLASWEIGYGISSGATRADGDADGDGDVDGHDYLMWQRQVGQVALSALSASAQAVPESNTVALALMALVTFGLPARRSWSRQSTKPLRQAVPLLGITVK